MLYRYIAEIYFVVAFLTLDFKQVVIIHNYFVLFLHPLISFGFDVWNINSTEHVATLEL